MSEIDVSIIIPTFNRANFLRDTLACIGNQTFPTKKLEVVVVDDGSTDQTGQIADGNFGFNLRYIYQKNQGSVTARNYGAELAKGNLLIFLDDDILLDRNYVELLVEQHRLFPHTIGMCNFKPYLWDDPTPFAERYASLAASCNVDSDGDFVEFTCCVTNNLSVEKTAFYEIGQMQDLAGDGPAWWGDVDFGYRALCLGYKLRCNGLAACYHRDYAIRDRNSFCKRAYKSAQMAVLLIQKHPPIKQYLPMFSDKYPVEWYSDSLSTITRKLFRRLFSQPCFLKLLVKMAYASEHQTMLSFLLDPIYRWIVGWYLWQGLHSGLQNSVQRAKH